MLHKIYKPQSVNSYLSWIHTPYSHTETHSYTLRDSRRERSFSCMSVSCPFIYILSPSSPELDLELHLLFHSKNNNTSHSLDIQDMHEFNKCSFILLKALTEPSHKF